MNPEDRVNQVPNTYLRQFFRFLGSRESLLMGTAESPETLARLDGSNSFRDYCQFFRNAREQTGQADIGLVLGRVNQLANMHGPVSTVLFQSSDIEDCLHLLERFTPLRLIILRIEWVEDENHIGLKVEFRESAGDIHVPVAETLLLSVAGVISAVSQGNVHPSRIELNYPRPAYAYQYQEAFKVPSFHFSRPHMCVLVSREDVTYRTGTDTDPSIRASAIKRCEELLRGILGSQSTSERIRQIFADNPGHLWTLKAMARHLNMSDRTLQRRLAEEGTRYQLLHNEWLMGEARQLLREKNLSIESIALLLGYSDVSNFRCACRRWFGTSPNEYRAQLRLVLM
jgi:AraC-like DNA-binding protein